MTLVARHRWEWDEVFGSLALLDPLLFALIFWEEDLTIPNSRTDLPKKWRGKQIISLEQRMMFYDGCVYRLWRDVMPEAAQESSQKVALRTSRKIAKTLLMESQLIQIAITNTLPGSTEGLFHAPRDNHMAPVTNRTVKKIKATPLFAMIFKSFDAAAGIMNFRTGWIWHMRIEGLCIGGNSDLLGIDGRGNIHAWKVRDMIAMESLPKLLTVNPETFALEVIEDCSICETGEQELFEVSAMDGWSLKATANHPFMTPVGWKRVDELRPGDMVAVLDSAPGFTSATELPKGFARLMGYLAGDGSLSRGTPGFTCFDKAVEENFFDLLSSAFPDVKPILRLPGQWELGCGNRGGGNSPNPLTEMLKKHGLMGKVARYKRVPDAIMAGSLEDVTEFLVGLFATDGSIVVCGKRTWITFSNTSRGLIDDVLWLMMRLGIRMRIKLRPSCTHVYPGGREYIKRDSWEISTSQAEDIIQFARLVEIPGEKGNRLNRAAFAYSDVAKAARVGAVPTSIIKSEVEKFGSITHVELTRRMGYAPKGTGSAGKQLWSYNTLSRAVTEKVNAVINSTVLTNLTSGLVGWRKIKSVASVGTEVTYDLSVPGTHNFIANGFVVHNSGSGTNMVGLRASVMMGDEGDYSQTAPHIEREQTALPGCAQLWGGVPRGVRGVFWQICNTAQGKEWSIHRYDIRANPLYHSARAFADQVKDDWYSQRVQTQVLGRDGEESVTSFPVIPVDASAPYVIRKFSLTEYLKFKDGLPAFLNIPVHRVEDAVAWLIHLDYGYSPSPTQIGISYFKSGMWRVLCRIEMLRIDTSPMANIIAAIDTAVLPKRAALIVIDAHGQGRGVLSALQTDERWDQEDYANRAMPVVFEGTTPVPDAKVHRKCRQAVRRDRQEEAYICDNCHTIIYDDRELADATRQTKAYLTDAMKESFANAARVMASGGREWTGGIAIAIGEDQELIEELAGTTEITSVTGQTRYNTPRDADHMTDMMRCLQSGAERYINLTSEWDQFKPADFGWGESFIEPTSSSWAAPWAAPVSSR